MATEVYDYLAGDGSKPVTLSSSSTVDYPSSGMYNVMGPVYLPRIYGKDLSAFEIASSGKVSITLHDTYAFDLDRDTDTATTFLATVPGDSFKIQANGDQVSMAFDANTNDMVLTASNNITFRGKDLIYEFSGDVSNSTLGDNNMTADGAIAVVAGGDLTMASSSNSVAITSGYSNVYVILDATVDNLNQYALNDVNISASNGYHLDAKNDATLSAVNGSMYLYAASSNVSLTMQKETWSANMFAASNLDLTTVHGLINVSAGSNVSLSATAGAITMFAPETTMTLFEGMAVATDGPVTVTSSSIQQTSSGSTTLTATDGSVVLSAAQAAARIQLDEMGIFATAAGTYSVYANSMTLSNVLDMTLAGATASMSTSNASVSLSSNLIRLTAASNIEVSSQDNVTIASQADTSITARGFDITTATDDIVVTASEGSVMLNSSHSNVTFTMGQNEMALYAASNIIATSHLNTIFTAQNSLSATAEDGRMLLTSGGDFIMRTDDNATNTAANNYSITATTGIMTLSAPESSMDLSAKKISLISSGEITQSADSKWQVDAVSDITMTSSAASVIFSASSNVSLQLDHTTKDMLLNAVENVRVTSGTNFIASASKNASISASSNLVLSGAAGGATLSMGFDQSFDTKASTYSFDATNDAGYGFNFGSENMVTIQSDKMIVRGGLDVYGILNSISVQNSELHINDKTLQLSYPDEGQTMTDGPNNSASGMVINGLPSSAAAMDPELAASIYEKSLQWNYNTAGVDGMLTRPGINTESYWELKGGRFQMTSTKANGKKVTFGFRINELDELEMIKVWDDAASDTVQTRRIAKFGKTIM